MAAAVLRGLGSFRGERITFAALRGPLRHTCLALSSTAVPISQALNELGREHHAQGSRPPRRLATMIPGDGVGPELMNHVLDVFKHAQVPVDFELVDVNSKDKHDAGVLSAITSIQRNGVGLKGNITTYHNDPGATKSKNLLLRTRLDLYANVIHCRSLSGVTTRHGDIDIVVIRENTEGEYASLEHESVPGVVECLKIITRDNSLRIAQYAFEFARKRGRKKVTAVHKANIMKLADGLFLRCCQEVAAGYPDIKYEQMIVDNATMQLVQHPSQFDVMLMPNLYGNVVNNVCAGLVGGAGVVPGANYGLQCAVFEAATRNTGKSIAGRNIANPTAMLLASCLMLDYMGLKEHADRIREATLGALKDPRGATVDVGGRTSSRDAVQAVISRLQGTPGRR